MTGFTFKLELPDGRYRSWTFGTTMLIKLLCSSFMRGARRRPAARIGH